MLLVVGHRGRRRMRGKEQGQAGEGRGGASISGLFDVGDILPECNSECTTFLGFIIHEIVTDGILPMLYVLLFRRLG